MAEAAAECVAGREGVPGVTPKCQLGMPSLVHVRTMVVQRLTRV